MAELRTRARACVRVRVRAYAIVQPPRDTLGGLKQSLLEPQSVMHELRACVRDVHPTEATRTGWYLILRSTSR
jgi:hypothetical protein